MGPWRGVVWLSQRGHAAWSSAGADLGTISVVGEVAVNQCRRFSNAQWRRTQPARSAGVACSVARPVTAMTTSVVRFLLSSLRVLRVI